jgi:hypothetical protein
MFGDCLMCVPKISMIHSISGKLSFPLAIWQFGNYVCYKTSQNIYCDPFIALPHISGNFTKGSKMRNPICQHLMGFCKYQFHFLNNGLLYCTFIRHLSCGVKQCIFNMSWNCQRWWCLDFITLMGIDKSLPLYGKWD